MFVKITAQKSQRIKSKWKKVRKLFKKKSERKKVRKSCNTNIFAGKKVMTFFPVLLILVTGRFHLQKSREIKSEFSVYVHDTNFL